MTVAAPNPHLRSVMTNICRHCDTKIERWSGAGGQWTHGEVDSATPNCDPEEVRRVAQIRRAGLEDVPHPIIVTG